MHLSEADTFAYQWWAMTAPRNPEIDGDKRSLSQLALSLDSVWRVPVDTFITDGMPDLLTRLSLIPYEAASPPAAGPFTRL